MVLVEEEVVVVLVVAEEVVGNMKLVIKFWRDLITFFLIALTIWLIWTQIFGRLDNRLPIVIALLITYIVSSYLILPILVRTTFLISRKGRIPRFVTAREGSHVDPVNIILIGTEKQLKNAFKKIGWYGSDKFNFKSILKTIYTFLYNKSYATAPISSLFLFGRRQDINFQQTIGLSPKKRHHIRFWGIDVNEIEDPLDIKFWTKKRKIKLNECLSWVGAGSEDIGLGFTKFTFKISHRVNHRVDHERKYILDSLRKNKLIGKVIYYKPGKFKVGKYISDGKIAVTKLKN